MKKILSILLTVTMVFSLVVSLGAPAASAATVTKVADYLPYGWTIFTANGPLPAGTLPIIHGKTETTYIYYTMGDIIQGIGGTLGGQVALVGYGPDNAFGTADDVVVSVAPVASDSYGTFAIATSSVPQDGAYAIRDFTAGLGAVLVPNIYIRYRFSIDQQSLTYNCSAQVISGWVFRGEGTGAAYSVSVIPAGQFAPYVTYVHVIYPSGADVYTSVLANGQFALAVNVNEKGVYRVYVEDNYGNPANPGGAGVGATEFGFIYAELPTGKLSITLSTYVDPTYLYNETTYQQEVVLKAVDQDGDPVSGATFSILTGFGVNYTVYEIDSGIYKVVGLKNLTEGLASFQVTSLIGGAALYSNVVSIPFKALSNFNPVVSVDVETTGRQKPLHAYTVTESTYDMLPCTVGYSLVIKPGVFDVISGYMIYDVYATVDGPVSMIEDTTPIAPPVTGWLANALAPSLVNSITQVGDPAFYSWATPLSNQLKGNGGIVYDGFYSGADWYYDAPRYLVTGPGTISVTIDQTNWKQVDPREALGEYNACCDPKTATFKICDIPGCDVTLDSSSMTVGTATDIKVNIASKGLACGCNVIVHVIPSWTNGTKVKELWYNISGGGIALPFGMFAPGSSYGASSDGTGAVTFKGVTANYCDYIKVEVFTTVTPSGCSPLPIWTFAFVDPYAIYAGVASSKLSYSIVGQTGDGNQYLVAGVPDTVIISGFVPLATLNYLRMDLAGDGSLYYNTDATYTAQDNADGTYTVQLTPPPSVWGTAYPNQIKIWLRTAASSTNGCRTQGYVVIPVKMPTFDTTLSVGCGETIPNDNIITEGFAERLTLSNLVDPRTGTALIISELWATKSRTCGIPTAWVDYAPCEGCNSNTIAIVALDNPNVDATPVVRPYITINGVNVRLYGAELTVVLPTIQVEPNKDIPFTAVGKPVTMLTFTAIDAHGKPMCGKTFSIYDINSMTDFYAITGFTSETTPYICDVDTGGVPYRPGFYRNLMALDGDGLGPMYVLTLGSSYQYHTGTTGSNGKVIYPFGPGVGGRYAATIVPDVAQSGAPKAPLQKFMSLMKLLFETVYQAPVVDTTLPVVEASAPAEVTAPMVTVSGKVTDNVGVVSLWIGATKVDFAPDGTFSAKVEVAEGANTIKVVAFDAASNMGEKDLTVTYVVAKVTVVKIQIGSDIMTVNGKAVQIDAPAEIKNGRTFLPLRAISEALGATVDWIAETQGITVTLGENTIGLQVGNTSAVVNGTVMTLDAAPYIKNNRTMVPFRVIAEGLGAAVEWDPALRIVTVTLAQ
jgi:phosphoribosylformimino-5-aminoimidazole carboxamide ribonucleotide (ProFAR) isomerase